MADPIHILHVEDDGDFAELTAETLEGADERFDVVHVRTADAGRDRLADDGFDCVISDYELPSDNGIAFLEDVREDHPALPFILFTGRGSEDVASDAISAGVTDYLRKATGVDQFELLANRIANAVESHRSRRTLTDRNQELRIYERIFNTMQGGACLYDTEGRFRVVNEYLLDFYDTTRAEIEGEPSGLIARIREEAAGDPYRELVEGDRSVLEGEIELEGSEGETVVSTYRLAPLSVDGTVVGVVGVARDVTERVKRERRLKTFSSAVSHDLRNPLTVAESHLELAREECSSPHLDDVTAAHERMEDLIADLLTLARDEDRLRDHEAVDLPTVVEHCWGNVRTEEATLETDVDGAVRADRSRLQQLLENLVGNAVEHGGPDVTVTVGGTDDGFYVEDDGPGIPEERRAEMFDVARSDSWPHRGIGLSIVERVAEGHGWTVDVVEGSEGGARFEIRDVEFVQSE